MNLKRIFILVIAAAIVTLVGIPVVSAQQQPQACDPYQIGQNSFTVQPNDLNYDAPIPYDLGMTPQLITQIASSFTETPRDRAEFANPDTHLAPAAAATVTAQGDQLTVYQGDCTESDVLAQLETGTKVTVLDGPLSSEGFAWWRIRRNGVTGWVMEGDGTEIWLRGGR